MHFSINKVLEIANSHFLESCKCHQANLIELKFQQQLELPVSADANASLSRAIANEIKYFL